MLGRALIADPYLPNELLNNTPEEIRPCIKCNMGCLTRSGIKGISCSVNAETGNELRVKLIKPCKPQKVIVIGGVAGTEAARKAAERGAEVVLMEKSDHLGGTVLAIASPD